MCMSRTKVAKWIFDFWPFFRVLLGLTLRGRQKHGNLVPNGAKWTHFYSKVVTYSTVFIPTCARIGE